MNKKILFDYIEMYEDGVFFHANQEFGVLRDIVETFNASCVDPNEKLYSPKKSFSSFFHFLDRTYCNNKGYIIYNHVVDQDEIQDFYKKSQLEKFDDMLNHHILTIYNDKPINKDKVIKFYKEAHDRFLTAVNNRKMAETKVQDLLDEESAEK